jgi:hypothetical protein
VKTTNVAPKQGATEKEKFVIIILKKRWFRKNNIIIYKIPKRKILNLEKKS